MAEMSHKELEESFERFMATKLKCHHGREVFKHGPCESCGSEKSERPSLWNAMMENAVAVMKAREENLRLRRENEELKLLKSRIEELLKR